MSKFTRVLKFVSGFHVIQHDGQKYEEEVEGAGIFEAPHAHANHFVECGFAEEFAGTMEEAMAKLTEPGEEGTQTAAPAAQPRQGGKRY